MIHEKSEKRILSGGDFVAWILAEYKESYKWRSELKAVEFDVNDVVEKFAGIMQAPVDDIWSLGRNKRLVMAGSVLCFGAVKQLGETMSFMARR